MKTQLYWSLLALTLLGACVSSKKYKALETKYQSLEDSTNTQIRVLEANNTILQKEIDTLRFQRARLEQKNATLNLTNEKSVAMINKLMKDYTSLEKEHITLLKNSAQEATVKKQLLVENQQKLSTSSKLLRKYRQQIFKLQNQVSSQEDALEKQYTKPNTNEDNPLDLRSRIVAKIPPQDRKYLDIEVDKGKVYIEIVDSVLFENDQKLTPKGEALLANLRKILKEYNLQVNGSEGQAENGSQSRKMNEVNRVLKTSRMKHLKDEQPISTISVPKNQATPLSLKNRKTMNKNPNSKTLIVVSEQDK
ncbi:MAG TPA: hypothetical protein DCS93_44105 [Microscillaceae bacterium]|nr:hypothetical protein [Microscillaceae bacterium]